MPSILNNRLANSLLLATWVSLAALWTDVRANTPKIPEILSPPRASRLVLKAAATGYQIYSCQPSPTDASQLAWTLKAPEAPLSKNRNQQIGKHYAGPTWELFDGSKIQGKVAQKVDAPQPDAIPWLLLKTTSTGKKGLLSNVEWVQRLNTVKGKAPTTGCDRQNNETRVAYQADYYFYAPPRP